MKIDVVIKNLENTISGKEAMLKSLQLRKRSNSDADIAAGVTIQFLEINIDELSKILNDCKRVKEGVNFVN